MNNVIDAIVADPRLIGAAFPFATGLVVAALLRAGFGRRMGGVAALGALIAFLLVYALIEGLPPIFAVTAKQKLFWLAVLGGIAGCLAGMGRRGGASERALLVLLPAAGVLWLGERQWLRGPDTVFVVVSAILWLAGAGILLRLRVTGTAAQGFAGGVQLVVAAIGLALVALVGASASLATLAGALAAGLGGVLLLDYILLVGWGTAGGLGSVGRLGVALPLIFIAAILVLFSEGVSAIAVALLSLVFLSGRIPLRIVRGSSRFARALEPVQAGVLAAIPAAIAVGVALLMVGSSGYP
jgi:hypothetical protein